ncbi:MAG: GTP-binding protein [Promethearchaeota archaeon]
MIIDALEKTIQIKVVYFGPALSGKTTSIKALFNHFGKKDDILSVESSIKRTLFFDYGVISFQNSDWLLKVHVYTTTGQDFYIVTRPVTLKAIDGIIFIVDSQQNALIRNYISWNELNAYFGDRLIELPKVLCFNKQDLPDKFISSDFLNKIKYHQYRNIERRDTIAINGEGILDSFEDILSLIFKDHYRNLLVEAFH